MRCRRRRFARAIVDCPVALLRADDTSARDALEALLAATGASAVFVEHNVEDPELGLCSTGSAWLAGSPVSKVATSATSAPTARVWSS